MTIKIQDTEYKLKYTIRALFLFERITGRAFEIKSLFDEFIFFYCLILANNPELNMTFDQFVDVLDADANLIMTYRAFINAEMAKQNQYKAVEDDNEEGDKKKA